jgi:hypothetical protein
MIDRIQIKNTRTLPLLIAASLVMVSAAAIALMPRAEAAAFTKAMVRLDHLTDTTTTGGRVCVVPATVATEGKLIVRFPTTAATDFVVNSTAANWTTNGTFESGFTFNGGAVTSMPITGNVASNVSGKDVTFTLSSDLTVGTSYCFNFSATSTLTTSSAGAAPSVFAYVETQTGASAQVDKSFWGTTIISNENVTVSAVVAPYFTMALNGSTDTFATNLSASGVNTSNGNRTIQVDSNALNGWIVWAKGTNYKTAGITETGTSPANRHGALTSVTAGGYAISNNTNNSLATPSASHAFSGGSEDYGLATTINTDGAGGGTVSLNGVYDGTSAGNAGVIDPTQYRPIANSNGTATADILNVKMLVTISNSTPPGADYTDTLTYVGAGQF